jgi:hypothetical protein
MGGNAMNKPYFTDDEGHMLDDPLFVIDNAMLDFSDLGMPPIHPNGMPITLEKIIGNVPYWIKFLPKDWSGETTRATIRFAVSNIAIENAKFDVDGFVSAKFVNALNHIMTKHEKKEICLTQNFSATIDSIYDPKKTYIYFHIEYAK